jgi:uncharacterized protein YsxB (DUF464 family)
MTGKKGGLLLIEVSVRKNKVELKGHAGRKGKDGIDRACTAVSALTNSLINSLQDLTEDKITTDLGSGSALIEWKELSEKGKLLIDSWFLAMTDINQEYNCIRFI